VEKKQKLTCILVISCLLMIHHPECSSHHDQKSQREHNRSDTQKPQKSGEEQEQDPHHLSQYRNSNRNGECGYVAQRQEQGGRGEEKYLVAAVN
jgi:hypothetical protein